MSQEAIVIFIILSIFFFILSGVPVYAALGTSGVIGLLLMQLESSAAAATTLIAIPQVFYTSIGYFPLLAIPFYVLAGEIMNKAGITDKLIDFAMMLVGRVPGSLAHANVVASMFFGGITGSAQADTSCIGGILIPSMVKEGYSPSFSVAVTAASSGLGPIIPPSIMMVLYGVTVGCSISALFMGGFIPGLLVGFGQMLLVCILNRKQHFPRREVRLTAQQRLKIIKEALYPLGVPVIICGGIISGIITATEAGVVAVVYSLIVGIYVLKTVRWKDLWQMLLNTVTISGSILLIIACAKVASNALTGLRMSELVKALFLQLSDSPIVFLLLINLLLLIMGMFMDGGASILLLTPVLAPIAQALGINVIHFGLVMVLNLVIGLVTPPLGQCVYIACGIARIPVMEGFKGIMPFILVNIIVLMIVTYVPASVLWIPTALGLTG